MVEKLDGKHIEVVVETEVVGSLVPMSKEEITQKMVEYRQRHPEEFAGTPEWNIKVTVENANRVYQETGILFHIM